MLFYRTDIMEELELEVPQTWEDVYNVVFELQQHGLDFFYQAPSPVAAGGLTDAGLMPFLFQEGGEWYTDDGMRSALNTPEALQAFKRWTDLYVSYKLPIQADFFNRFRTGEMPIGVSNYWTYVLLKVAAPELRGRWEMAPMPGTEMQGGVIDRSNGGALDCAVMFRDVKDPEASWEFLKWWTSEEAQVRFGREMEGIMGVEARWSSANVAALSRLPWDPKDIEAILAQWEWYRETPVVLGGYFTARHVYNAWNEVVLLGEHPRDALEEAVKEINKEMRKKQEEFGLAP
jgi:ABC-type glycerol-3-phosphate transport system substrate-binding protein